MTILTSEPESIKIQKPDYKGICDVLDRFIKIYELTGDKEILLHMTKNFAQPFVVIETEDGDEMFLNGERDFLP